MAKKICVTGAASLIGAAIVLRLNACGYHALDLNRSEEARQSVLFVLSEIFRDGLEHGDDLCKGAETKKTVIHSALSHNLTEVRQSCGADRKIIELFSSVRAGSNRLLVETSSTSMTKAIPEEAATEQSPTADSAASPRNLIPRVLLESAYFPSGAVVNNASSSGGPSVCTP